MEEKNTSKNNVHENQSRPTKNRRLSRKLKTALVSISALLLIPLSYAGYVYASSPSPIRNPKMEHYHFRMQIVVDGKAENFAEDKYQQDYAKDQCNANLPEQPIHFHDIKDQFTHIHWEGMTGGMVMKYYGWNYIGGVDKALGYKLDDLSDVQKVNTHGNFLPQVPDNSKFYVYTGSETGYEQRDFKDWKNQDLEKFFAKTSNFPLHEENVKGYWQRTWEKAFPPAEAHGTEDHSKTPDIESESEKNYSQSELTQINNLIGNVVIFVQKDAPTDEQVKERFSRLEPLTASTCGG